MIKPKSHSGQSLVEILVALGVALLVIVALIRATAISMKGSGFSKAQATGTRYAQEAIEWIRGQRDEGWSNLASRTPDTGFATYCLSDLSSWPASSGECAYYSLDGKYKREAVLTDEEGGKIGVEVTVKWLEVGGERQSRLNTYFTNWRGAVGTTGTPTPTPTPPSLFWEAEEGEIDPPFIIGGGYIYQETSNYSDPSLGGKALYRFTLVSPGDYLIKAVVDAPNTGANSFFINIDSEPVYPTMVWDILPLTSGFEERTVSWRGSGSASNNEFNPKIFTLSAGDHELIVRGREANTLLDSLRMELATP
jgi:type II secretory pathway pseudopilin PulG